MLSTTHVDDRPRVVVIATDVVGERMAGPGIRVVRIAEQLVPVADVTLAVSAGDAAAVQTLRLPGAQVRTYGDVNELVSIVAAHDIAFCQIIDTEVLRRGTEAGCRFVFDLYNALPAEAIGAERIGGYDKQPEKDDVFRDVLAQFRFAVRTGCYFVTSNERQRDFWIGYMMASGALLPSTLGGRSTQDVIGLVPFGIQDGDPQADGHPLRDLPDFDDKDFILLWAGGIWDWFDAETPIRAVADLRANGRHVRLVFYGTTHPNPLIGRPASVERAMALAAQLGVLDHGVHFIEGWVPAEQRTGYLLDADAAISAHTESFETRYAFRTRVLDHFWASLPSIVSEGDWFADYIREHELGEVVPYGDVAATRRAILKVMRPRTRRSMARRIAEIREDWRWSMTTLPLQEVVRSWRTVLPPPRMTDVEMDAPRPTAQ
jgi:glycosyltransferase involved in cell wall biosynthesis